MLANCILSQSDTAYISVSKMKHIQDLNIKNVKGAGMACQKVCKQGRDDVLVTVRPKPKKNKLETALTI